MFPTLINSWKNLHVYSFLLNQAIQKKNLFEVKPGHWEITLTHNTVLTTPGYQIKDTRLVDISNYLKNRHTSTHTRSSLFLSL